MRRLVKEGQQSPVYEQTIVRPDGTELDVEVVGIPFAYQDGTAVQIIAHDITERKRMERQLKENEARYKKAQRLGQVGNWEYNVQTARFWGSDEAKRIYGFDLAAEDFSVDEVESCIPERERVHQALVDLIEKNAEYDLEFEIYPKNSDQAKTIVSVAELERDARGNPLKVTGVIHDITERKQIEVALKESEEKFKKLAEYAPVPISIIAVEDETRFLYVNREWERSRGYTRDDLDTVSPIDTVHPDMRPTVLENARKRMEGHNVPDRYELKVVHRTLNTPVLRLKSSFRFQRPLCL
jgi:PAS domain S-box-containing protein